MYKPAQANGNSEKTIKFLTFLCKNKWKSIVQSKSVQGLRDPKPVKFALQYQILRVHSQGTGDIPTAAPIGVVINRRPMRVINQFLFWSTNCLVNLSVAFSVPEDFYSSYHLLPE